VSAAFGRPAGMPRLAAVSVLRDGRWVDVRWSEADGLYVAMCSEFPGLSWLAPTPEEADAGLRRAIAEIRADIARGDDR
jgi:hypothetical protein